MRHMPDIHKFMPVSFTRPLVCQDEDATGLRISIALKDAQGRDLTLSLSPGFAWDLSAALAPNRGSGAVVRLFPIGSQVVYAGDLPCGSHRGKHVGIVDTVTLDASGEQIVTVGFTCADVERAAQRTVQDIPASELQWAGESAARQPE